MTARQPRPKLHISGGCAVKGLARSSNCLRHVCFVAKPDKCVDANPSQKTGGRLLPNDSLDCIVFIALCAIILIAHSARQTRRTCMKRCFMSAAQEVMPSWSRKSGTLASLLMATSAKGLPARLSQLFRSSRIFSRMPRGLQTRKSPAPPCLSAKRV